MNEIKKREANEMGEFNQMNELNEMHEMHEMHKTDAVNEVNEVNEVNDANAVNAANEANEANEANAMNEAKTIKVFVVDSSEVWRKILINHIRSAPDMTVVSEINSSQGSIIMLDEVNPDVIMLDVNAKDRMPVTEVITQLRAINPAVRIILCTDQSNKHAVAAAIERGAQDFITKPYKRENVLRCIYECMAKSIVI